MAQADSSTILTEGEYVQVNGINMYYEEHGRGWPLLLLHGGTGTSQSWQPFINLQSLIPHFRVITPDSRGHGKTNNSTEELSYPLMADDVAAFIQALNLTKPLVFGYSDGAQIALEIGMRHPGLTTALVVAAAFYKFSETYLNFLKEIGFERPGEVNIEILQSKMPESVEFLKTAHARAGDPDYWQTLLKQISKMWWTPLDYSARDFQKITEPTLVLLGDRDGIIELDQAVEMYRLISNAELAILPNAAHMSPNPKLLTDTVLEFFLRHTIQSTENNIQDAT